MATAREASSVAPLLAPAAAALAAAAWASAGFEARVAKEGSTERCNVRSHVDVDDVETARKVLDLVERLDDHDDVQSVAANFNIPDEALAQLG